MPELDRSFVVAIYGARPSFHPAAGEVMALVEVDAGPDRVLVDRERDRCRVERTPAWRDLDKWCSPAGLILAARRREWGLSIVEDRYAGEGDGPAPFGRSTRPRAETCRPAREVVPCRGGFLRASIPGDLCSCLRCRDLVIARRSRWGGIVRRLDAPGRLYRRALRLCGGLSGCQGPGAAAVEHGRDCTPFRLGDPGPIRRDRRSRARMLAQLVRGLMRDAAGRAFLRPRGPGWFRNLKGGAT